MEPISLVTIALTRFRPIKAAPLYRSKVSELEVIGELDRIFTHVNAIVAKNLGRE
jgi:hypothetical protein